MYLKSKCIGWSPEAQWKPSQMAVRSMHQVYFSKVLTAEMMFPLLCSVLKKWYAHHSQFAGGSVGVDIHPLYIVNTVLVILPQFRWVNQWKYVVHVLGLFFKTNQPFLLFVFQERSEENLRFKYVS